MSQAPAGPVPIVCYSDILCVWAHVAERRLEEVRLAFGDQVRIEQRFCSVFGDTARKMAITWKDKGGYEGFNAHLRHVGEQFPEIAVHPRLWLDVRPASSMGAHLILEAVAIDEANGGSSPGAAAAATRAMRHAFFAEARDIADQAVQRQVLEAIGVDFGHLQRLIADGRAFAALASDHQDADAAGVQGSPTLLLNEGRQKLYGNVGYRILEANILELLRTPAAGQASWC